MAAKSDLMHSIAVNIKTLSVSIFFLILTVKGKYMNSCPLHSETLIRQYRLPFDAFDEDVYPQLKQSQKRVYDKLWLARSQNIPSGDMKTIPKTYPVVIKPRINLHGFGLGMSIAHNYGQWKKRSHDSNLMWMQFFSGDILSVDMAVNFGNVLTYRATKGIPSGDGSFQWWESQPHFILPQHIKIWCQTYLSDYQGPANVELIGGNMIECHLRLGEDMVALDDSFFKCLKGQTLACTYKPSSVKNYFFPIFSAAHQRGFSDKDESVTIPFVRHFCAQPDLEQYQVGEKQRYGMFTTTDFQQGRQLQKRLEKNLLL